MGYDLRIGEMALYVPAEEDIDAGRDRPELRFIVAPIPGRETAARFACSEGRFAEVVAEARIDDLFFTPGRAESRDPGGLMPKRVGAARLTRKHLARFEEALAYVRRRGAEPHVVDLVRWLAESTREAIERCEVPALHTGELSTIPADG